MSKLILILLLGITSCASEPYASGCRDYDDPTSFGGVEVWDGSCGMYVVAYYVDNYETDISFVAPRSAKMCVSPIGDSVSWAYSDNIIQFYRWSTEPFAIGQAVVFDDGSRHGHIAIICGIGKDSLDYISNNQSPTIIRERIMRDGNKVSLEDWSYTGRIWVRFDDKGNAI